MSGSDNSEALKQGLAPAVKLLLQEERIYQRLDNLDNQLVAFQAAKQKAHDHGLQARIKDLMSLMRPEDVVDAGPFVRIGKQNDGGYIMYEPGLAGLVAYSFGINDDVSWDADMAKRGFDVYMYDHTIEALPYEDSKFNWLKQGILGTGETPELKTLEHFLRMNDHFDRSDMVLKIDVEGYEWDVFAEVSDEVISKFQQIVVEYHWFDHVQNQELVTKMQKGLSRLHRLFAPVHVHANNYCDVAVIGNVPIAPVLEITYLRRSSFRTVTSTKTFPTAMDQPNNPGLPDIWLGSFVF
ncbi:hypothetical protein CN155_01655 [Sinorhizobium meliloti]|uniref:FkbM family methyltransferase n=1 Tax=Rhizobium meliloti TaxID=382 RepID=UPI000FDCBC76|nr:FkbM family methyltransferase [Sinorhizobium meliloti]RVK62323.1 hypothetical protein CN155_01655 [Sinorhizobium meliloti]